MNLTLTQRSLSVLALSAAALLLAACDQSKPPTVGEQIDAGIERSKDAASEAGRDIQAAGQEIQQESAKAASAIAEGAADIGITARVKTALAGDAQLSAISIGVDTTNNVVTLTGPAPSQAAADRASDLAKAVDGVTEVRNQLVVGGAS
jgi:hyperosmotically inducible periplasmic protein